MDKDPGFVSVTEKEMANALHVPDSEMQGEAQGICNENCGSIPSVRKKRPVPVPPSNPSVVKLETGQPDPAVRRKRRPIPTIPTQKKLDEADSEV